MASGRREAKGAARFARRHTLAGATRYRRLAARRALADAAVAATRRAERADLKNRRVGGSRSFAHLAVYATFTRPRLRPLGAAMKTMPMQRQHNAAAARANILVAQTVGRGALLVHKARLAERRSRHSAQAQPRPITRPTNAETVRADAACAVAGKKKTRFEYAKFCF